MRYEYSPELETYRTQVRAFIAEHSPFVRPHAGVRAPEPEQLPAIRAWIARLYDAGYLGQDWPTEHGGRPDGRPELGFIVAEELARARAWGQVGAAGLASGALLGFGTDEQKRRFLPRIRSGQDLWCQLFSEPGAGSDLAAMSTRAVLEGDHYVVSGQKVWTTNGHHADVGYLLARTDPGVKKQAGITAFALDMSTPGIDVRPLREITGDSDFNEVFLDEVRIPVDQVIGAVNDGWRVANTSLGHERSAVAARAVELEAALDDLFAMAGRITSGDRPALADSAVRQRLGAIATRVHVAGMMSKAGQSRMLHRSEDAADAPAVKIFFSQANLATTELGVALQGIDGLGVEGDPYVHADGWWQDAFLIARSFTIAGGANEVLKNVIAERALGLPREK
ncbi:acyl-CoA dehydrogenase family protein [Nocardioides sp. cx-173]|uniref:acyl-CoA dehydrogenase family protein n=1 Tax=Nocardioides sp. cx-173 TaxID=2898796 RepID=UPI001E2F8842|nr:acyl-CoA dehydrogenase family protein [Nocardioides sp. cx-173]MCD4524269.1 acyl-CoA dehydrogenase family protein [Nocardioides sp. cx-173]UGB41661.1 acyl-CoA dehydrogenase family protein [Nocardioides sp. cx-173]